MTVIKGSSALAQRAAGFRSRPRAVTTKAETEAMAENAVSHDERDEMIERLSRRLGELEAELEAMREEAAAACEDMLERGRAEGAKAAGTLDRERLGALSASLAEAVAALGSHIDRNRDVAIDIARAALDRLFADPSLYHGMVAEAARRQAAALARGSIIGLRVSVADFPDAATLAALPELGTEVRVEADPSLPSGSCLFDLKLGALDASIAHQASVIEGIFAQAESSSIRTDRKAASA